MKEMDRLINLLFPEGNDGSKVVDLKFFPGEQSVTVEEFCKEVHSGFVQVDSGQSEKMDDFEEDFAQVSMGQFLTPAS